MIKQIIHNTLVLNSDIISWVKSKQLSKFAPKNIYFEIEIKMVSEFKMV